MQIISLFSSCLQWNLRKQKNIVLFKNLQPSYHILHTSSFLTVGPRPAITSSYHVPAFLPAFLPILPGLPCRKHVPTLLSKFGPPFRQVGFYFCHATWIILINFKFDRKPMPEKQREELKLRRNASSPQSQPLFYLLSQLRFFGFKSTVLTVLLFVVWNFPLFRIIQMFIFNNRKVTDYYLTSIFNIARFMFSIEQYVNLDFVDSNWQNNNFMNLLIFVCLGMYCLLYAYIYFSLKKTNPKTSPFLISILKAFTLIIYLFSFYFYLIAGTALIKDMRASIYKYIPFSIFNLILTFVIIFVIETYSNQNQYQSPVSLSVVNSPQHVVGQLAKLVLAGFLATRDYFADKNLFIILFSIASSIVLLAQLKSTLTSVVYLHSQTQRLHQLFCINTLCTYIIILIYYFTKSDTVINNCLFINITVNILAVYSLKLYNEKRREWLFQDEGDESHDQGELVWKMIQYIMLLKVEGNVKYSFASLSVIRHVKECSNPSCFCEASKDRSAVELASDRAFLLQLVYLKLKNLIELNPQSFSLRMIGVNFKTIFQQSFTDIHTEFERVMRSCQSIEGTKAFLAYQFRKEFQGRVLEEIRQGNQIRLQELFEEQKFRDELIMELQEMGHRNVKKYSMLAQDYCSLNKVYTLSNLITSAIRNVQLKWAQFKSAETHNIRVLEVFLVYFECMLPSRLQTSEIKSLINKRLHSLRFLKGTDESTLNRAIYTAKATVLQTRFKGYDDIRIVNASANCSALLRLSSKELIGKEIHDVLPHYMVAQHKQLVEERLSQFISLKHLDKVRPAFMADLSGHCYSGKVHVRVSATGDQLHFFVLLLKQDENNFVIMDDHFNIQGIGRRIEREQIFYRQNVNTPILNFCKEDFLKLLANRQSVKKNITVTQMIKRIDTRSMIKCSNLDSLEEDDLKALFDMVSFQCQVDVAKHPLRNTVYYSIKFGELKKTLKISEKRSNQEFQKKLQSKLGTLIYVNPNSNPIHKKDPNRTIESDEDITQLQIENLSQDCIKGNAQDDNMLAINQTSSTASSLKDSESLSYSELMLRLKEYLLDMQAAPMFSVPMMKVFIVVCGTLLIICGFIECTLISSGVKSYSQIYQASTFVNNINQMMEVSLNNDEILQKYCTNMNFSSRCSYLNKTQSILHSQLYQLMATSVDGYLSTQTSLFGIRYYSALDTIVQVTLHDSIVEVPTRQFLQLFYFSLKQVQNGGQNANNLQFLNSNWNLLQSVNAQSLDYYQQVAADQLQTLTEIIYAYTAFFIVLALCFALPFHIFLARCNARIESIIRLYQLVDIELCKRLMEVEKAIIPLISERYVERSFNSADNTSTQNTKLQPKRYSQFTYHSDHYQKIIITIVFLVIIALNAVTLANYIQYIPLSQRMQSSLNDLIYSQNSAMQNYITIKMSLFNDAPLPVLVPSASLMFVEDVRMVFSTFSSTDPSLSAAFNSLTMRDVCSYNKPFIQNWQLSRCTNFTTNILARGINSATSNLVRQTQSTQNQYPSLTSSSYLSSSPFQDLDDQLIFQLAVYHQMKRIIIQSFNRSLSSFSDSLQSNNYVSVTFVGLAVLSGIWALRKKRGSLGNIFGIILQIPQRVFTENKLVMKIVAQNLVDQ